ncbi:MAG: methyltransferase domain-containing protein [Myxococcales bacterium]|nr:methyltransferase domain-containing protein [Myxococcales bacterium]
MGDVGDVDAAEAYVLGFSEHEQHRLALQDRLFARFTRALLVEAGVGPGMSVLDVGAGVGDVSMLAAELVGAAGSVTGVERSGAYVRAARRRAADRGLAQIDFVEADLFDFAPPRSYDAIVGRFILEWIPDPTAALRRLAGLLRPGGVLAFQDYDHPLREGQHSYPVAPFFERVLAGCVDALAANGLHRRMGAMLRGCFIDAGLPAPALHVDAAIGGGPDWEAYAWLAAGAVSLAPHFADRGLAAELTDLEALTERLRADVTAGSSVAQLAPLIGAWVRTPSG